MTLATHGSRRVAQIGSALLGWRVSAAIAVLGGGNNRIFRLTGARGAAALKFYPLQHQDSRDRLNQEFCALSFLDRHGITDIPKPLARDDANRCAAYEWIDGGPTGSASATEVDVLASFFVTLQDLRRRKEANHLACASASCFSPAMAAAQLHQRLRRLCGALPAKTDVSAFLQDSVVPETEVGIRRLREGCGQAGIDFDAHLPRSRQALSPSDFGLHNTLRRPDGRLAFLDFEYFGWDDPAKAVADVMFHPGTSLPLDLARRYRSRVETAIATSDPNFPKRLDLMLPIIGLMWCVILLNEFLPERWARRQFAGHSEARHVAEKTQLEKARNLFHRIAS